MEAMSSCPGIEPLLVHTGQHYDREMSELFFEHLGLPRPDFYLGVGSGGHGEQTGKIMIAFEKVLQKVDPDLVLVVGDVNSTIACGLVAVKMGVKLAHVEAGLRSFDRSMPEEVNRVLTDQISDYLFITERSAEENLNREGIPSERIFFVGNVMIDTLLRYRKQAQASRILDELSLKERGYVLVTLHRPANVDEPGVLEGLVGCMIELSRDLPVVFPVHPRTRTRLEKAGLWRKLISAPGMRVREPLGYLDFLRCMEQAAVVVTDSGGIQGETTALGVPCVTARETTELPVTVSMGTNVVVGRSPRRIGEEVRSIIKGRALAGRMPELWDGKAAERIVKILWDKEGRR